MSILNMASDGLFNVLIILVRALVKFGPQSRENLLALSGAKFDVIDPSKISMSLGRWTELGLFTDVDGSISLSEIHKKSLTNSPDVAELRLPKVLRSIIFAPENNVQFWSTEENRSADCTRGLAWLLAQNVYTLDTGSHKSINQLESEQILDESRRMFQNDTRWNGARTWSVYLGFARQGATLVIDPTPALRESLDEIFTTDRMTARDFVDRSAEVLPVLDGGTYRYQIEEVLKDTSWQKPPSNFVSTSLSRAIKRLLQEGLIADDRRSDTDAGINLMGFRDEAWLSITHLRRLPRSGAV